MIRAGSQRVRLSWAAAPRRPLSRAGRGRPNLGGTYFRDLDELLEYRGLMLLEETAHMPVVDQFGDVAPRKHEI